jgi:hypothetical protein
MDPVTGVGLMLSALSTTIEGPSNEDSSRRFWRTAVFVRLAAGVGAHHCGQ